jgi:HD-GYP domain-containing protein (c-di-GMP phosphodiesterase class II)
MRTMTDASIRRADFMMVLAYASDLATGHSRDFALKSCVLAMRIAELAGLPDQVRRNAYHQSMLRYVGCNADTDLLSATFGDEIALRQDLVGLDMGNRAELGRVFVQAFKRVYYDLAPDAQAKAIEAAMSQALAVARPVLTAHCEVAQRIGERLGLSEDIRRNLGQIYERWDGKGLPRGLSGEDVLPAVRLITLAQDAIALSETVGIDGMAETIASRADGPYEADLARLVSANAAGLMEGIGPTVDRDTILALEPDPPVTLNEEACDEAFLAIADMIDMRMPFTLGHSRMVSELAAGAGKRMGLPEPDVRALRWSGCIHDIGELVVPVATWMRNGPLSVRERDTAMRWVRLCCATTNGWTVRDITARSAVPTCLRRPGSWPPPRPSRRRGRNVRIARRCPARRRRRSCVRLFVMAVSAPTPPRPYCHSPGSSRGGACRRRWPA